MTLKIAISWPAWSWKTTVIKEIVKLTWFHTADVGQIFRERAVKKWMIISDYDKFVEDNPQEDVDMDNNFKKLVENCTKDIILSWRVGFYFVPEIISIWLDVDPRQWAKRIFNDNRWHQEKKYNSLEEVIKTNKERMEKLEKRLEILYGINFMNKNNYTKIIDTTGKNFEEVVSEVINYIEELKKI